MSGKKRAPNLSPEDRALWERFARQIKPLKKQDPEVSAEDFQTLLDEEMDKAGAKKTPAGKTRSTPGAPPPAAAPPEKPKGRRLVQGGRADLDRRQAERLRRGQMTIEAVLDLHGHGQDEAERELSEFLGRARAEGRRCVLVVTGKGRYGEPGRGVLRQRLPEWLNQPENRAKVLTFAQAQPKHGGAGAFYVLLKRKR